MIESTMYSNDVSRTSARPILPTNLKERIAALEQRNGGSNASTRATSPTPSVASTTPNGVQTAGALRDKIAKFEKKGGVPVPRGSFGLGAPPTAEGHRRQGELYGNRILGSTRALSAQYTGLSTQYTGGSRAPSPIGSIADYSRRSFSTSIAMGDFDEGFPDFSPMSSPALGAPPDTPESATYSPESSPLMADSLAYKRAPTRGTSFHEALEFARKTEAAKLLAATSSIKKKSTDSVDGDDKSAQTQTTPDCLDEVIGHITSNQVSPEHFTELLHESPNHRVKELPSAEPVSSDTVITPTSITAKPAASGVDVVEDHPNDSEAEPIPMTSQHPALTIRKRVPPEPVIDKANPIGVSPNADREISPPRAETENHVSAVPAASMSSNDRLMTNEKGNPDLEKRDAVSPEQPRVDSNTNCKVVGDAFANGDYNPGILAQSDVISRAPTIVVDEALSATSTAEGESAMLAGVKATVPKDSKPVLSGESLDNVSAHVESSTESLPQVRGGHGSSSDKDQVTAPRARPRIQPPQPSSLLSPPPTGYRSARTSSSASSLASPSSDGSRPLSMIETSPGQISRALRMTPATGRGVPIFLPPGLQQPRKSDFVYFPPSPDGVPSTATDEGPGEFGDATLGHQRRGSLPDVKAASASSTTFRAVVHGKVKEMPASATFSLKVPETPDKRATILQHPLSPGHGELATLLQESMLLEDTLMSGKLPGESPDKESAAAKKEREKTKAKEEARSKEELPRNAAQLRAKRDMPLQGRLKHTFLMPLSKAKAMQKKEALAKIPEPRRSYEDSSAQQMSNQQQEQVQSGEKAVSHSSTPSTPTKSSKPSRFPSFKRFGSISLMGTSPDTAFRQSNSTSSAEDSNLIITPPDNMLEFGTVTPTEESRHAKELSFSFPSLSPKKSVSSVGRAASFAEKMWSRARTKSNGSVLSSNSALTRKVLITLKFSSSPCFSADQSNEELVPQLPALNPPPSLELPPIADFSLTLQPPSDKGVVQRTASRSSSLRHRSDLPPTQAAVAPRSLLTPQVNTGSRFLDFNSSNPSSPMSISSLPSPLFDKEIFDAFPSVPGTTPTPSAVGRYIPRRDEQGLTAAAAATADFDSALLSSAIHLAARNNTSTTSAATSQ